MADYKIMQWNCRGVRANRVDLRNIVSDLNPVALGLQELKVTKKKQIPRIPGYKAYHHIPDVNQAKGGVAFLVKSDFPQRKIPLNTTLQAVAVRVTINKPVTLCSVYLPPNKRVSYQELKSLVEQLPAPYMILGDFNAYSTVWGSRRTTARGRMIERLLDKKSLCLFNRGTPTYLCQTGRRSVLDLTICHPTLYTEYDWRVTDDPLGSDHFPIVLSTGKVGAEGERPERWKINKADWDEFEKLCSTSFLSWESIQGQEDPSKYLTDTLKEVSTKCIPKTSSSRPHKPCPWFNDNCRQAKKARRKALKKFEANMSVENMIEYHHQQAKTKLVYNSEKRESFRQYVNNIDTSTPLKKVYDRVKKLEGRPISTLNHLNVGTEMKETTKEIADTFADHFCRVSSSNNCSDKFLDHKQREERSKLDFSSKNQECYNKPFTLGELKHALQQSKDSSPGPDDIHYQMLKHLPEQTLELFLDLYNHIWSTGTYPKSWSEAVVVPIPKPGKDATIASSYRPIAMTSCLAKTMERMVNNRLVWFLESNNKFTPYQSGFRKGRSTTDHLVRLESFIRKGFANNEHVVAVFFDLEKAYDTTWKFGILKDLKKLGLKGRLTSFVEGFLANRRFNVRLGATLSKEVDQEMGVPQGCVLSVTLFGIKINSIAETLLHDVECCLYVDDFVICYRGTRMATIERRLRGTLKNLEEWSLENGFKFSESKTTCVHFCRRRQCTEVPSLTLHGKELKVEEEVKFLGLVFDRILSFKPHVEYLRRKCQRAMNLLKMLSHTEWGADREILLTLYKTYIQSRLDYGSIVYASAAKSYLDWLKPVQNQGLRLAVGAFRSSPAVSLHVEAGVPPLDLRRYKLSLQYAIKVKANPKNPVHDVIFNEDHQIFKQKKKVTKPFSVRVRTQIRNAHVPIHKVMDEGPAKIPPWIQTAPTIRFDLCKHKKKETSASKYKKELAKIRAEYPEYTEVYTDGSKDGKRVGYAANTPYGNRKGALHSRASIFTAEGHALESALNWIKVSQLKEFIIFTDSKSCLDGLRQHDPQNPRIQSLRLIYTQVIDMGKKVILCWVPSHIDIEGNEEADQAAKRALQKTPGLALLPHTDLLPITREEMMKEWQSRWSCCKDNKLYGIEPSVSKKQEYKGLTRMEESRLARLRIGHSLLTHGHLMRGDVQPVCQCCQVALTIEHLLLSCKATKKSREKHLKNATSMASVFEHTSQKELLSFLRETQMFEKL